MRPQVRDDLANGTRANGARRGILGVLQNERTGWFILGVAVVVAASLVAMSEQAYRDYLDLMHNLQVKIGAFSADTKGDTPAVSFQVELANHSKTYQVTVYSVEYFLYGRGNEYLGYFSTEMARGVGVPLEPGKTVVIPVAGSMHNVYADRFQAMSVGGEPVSVLVKGNVHLRAKLARVDKNISLPFELRLEVRPNAVVGS